MNLKDKAFNLENSLKELQASYNTLLKQKEVLMQLANEAIIREYKLQEKNKELEATVLSLKTSLFDVSLELYLEETKAED
jgi:hypothetical protein